MFHLQRLQVSNGGSMSYQDEYDRCKANGWLDLFKAAANKYQIDLEILLAQCSRETCCHNIFGDAGHGRGLMQIDDRWHRSWLTLNRGGMDPATNIDYAGSLLAAEIKHFNALNAGLAAYNSGRGSVEKAIDLGLSVDHHTAHGNYSKDVLERSKAFQQIIEADNA